MAERRNRRTLKMNTFFKQTVYARWELVLMRGLCALVIWDALPLTGLLQPGTAGGGSELRAPEWHVQYDEVPKPVGIALLKPEWVTAIADEANGPKLAWAAMLLLALYALGIAPVISTPLLLALTVLSGTLNNSQGAITHHLQAVSLVLLAQSGYLIWELARRRKWRTGILGTPADRECGVISVSQQAIIATYVVSGITKLKESGLSWFVDAARFPIQLKKNNRMGYYNELEEPSAATGFWSNLPAKTETLFLESPNLCRVVIGSGLVLELVAVLALAGRAWAFAVGSLLVLFHLSISEVMSLNFRFNVSLLLILFVLPAITAALNHWSRRSTAQHKPGSKPKRG